MVRFDASTRRLSLDPRSSAFYSNPYAAYAEILAQTPVAFWEELGMWCFFGYEEVNRLLRDRRFGREILHVTTAGHSHARFRRHRRPQSARA
jgi:unspecific monooxygenase